MSKFWNEYHVPASVDEALALLAHYDGRARVVAGGTDLLLDLQALRDEGTRPNLAALVDVTRLAGADTLAEEDGYIVIGCGVTHDRIVASPLIQERATALAESCAVVGGPQVRNVATLVGNVAHALPAADGTIALMALGAEARVHGSPGSDASGWQPLAALFKGPGRSAVDPTREVITAVRFRPTRGGEGSAFARVMRPQGVALPILGMAVRLSQVEARVEEISISTGPVAPVPFRATRTENFLRGRAPDAETLDHAARILLTEAAPRTSAHRATREYRMELLCSLLHRTVQAAMHRAIADQARSR